MRGYAKPLMRDNALDLNASNVRVYSALMLAAYNDEKGFCEALLCSGADVNSIDNMDNAVLMEAAYKGDIEILSLLL